MANEKISQYPLLTNAQAAANDSLPIVDDSAIKTKRITISELDLRWAAIAHNHVITDVTGLQTALNAKEATITAGTTFQYYRGDKTWQTLDKAAVGLNNVDNTSDASKPVSTAQSTALGFKADQSSLNTHTSDVANPHSVTKTQVGLSNVDNTSDANKPVSTAQATALGLKENSITAGSTSQYYRGDKTWQTLDKTAVGLSNVDNTSDASKPVSTATQTALSLKADIIQNNVKQSFSIPSNHTAIMGEIEIALNQTITIETNGRLVLI